jgi:hypothetical protein
MKKTLFYSFILAVVVSMSSCAAFGPVGVIYTQVQLPIAATSNSVGTKVGSSQAMSILGLIATGDASINAAAKAGNITKISHVDYENFGILGIYFRQTTYVYGE